MLAEESNNNEVCYLRLRGLPWSCNHSDITNFLKNVKICEGDHSILFIVSEEGKRTGDALVRVPSRSDYEKALTYNRNYIGKRYIEVVTSSQAEFDEHEYKTTVGENDNIVRLRGLPYSCTEKDIRDFLTGTEILPDGVSIIFDNEGRCSGDAYVEFATKEDVNVALEKHRQKISSRFIEVYRSNKSEKSYMIANKPTPLMSIHCRRRERSPLREGRKYRPSPGDYPSPFSHQRYHRSRDDDRYSDDHDRSRQLPMEEKYIHMRGLPFECNEVDVEEFFHPFFVVSIGFCYSQDDKFTGECDVYFEHESDVYQAMNKDKKKIGKRYVELFVRTRKNIFLRRTREYAQLPPPQRISPHQDYIDTKSYSPYHRQYQSYNPPHAPPSSMSSLSYLGGYEAQKVKIVSYDSEQSGSHFGTQMNQNFTSIAPVHEYFQDPTTNVQQNENISNMGAVPFTDKPPAHIHQNSESYPFY